MATTNRDRISQCLDVLCEGLREFVNREMINVEGAGWVDLNLDLFDVRDRKNVAKGGTAAMDAQALLDVMWKKWSEVFNKTLGHQERSVMSELKTVRNDWAHQKAFDLNRTLRALDSMRLLLEGVGSPKHAAVVQEHYEAVLMARQEEVAAQRQRKAAREATEGKPTGGLKAWRDVIEPHPDVQKGEYSKSEFAVDLNQVHNKIGAAEYRDPMLFYQRTFLTEGLKRLLVSGLRRLSGKGGDPVIQLQTNFGGGKTHSMLAMYHAVCGKKASELPGLEDVIKQAGIPELPKAMRAVFVGTAHGASEIDETPEGLKLHTVWGRMAYQLAGPDGYALVRKSDENGTPPGSNELRKLFDKAGTALILIDEWVAYIKHSYTDDSLPSGNFDANLTFAQNLTEAVKSHPHTLLLASLPESDIEAGGEGGRQALARLQHTFGRVETNWQPATTEETFRIVRQRLFQPITSASSKDRDAVIKAFMTEYGSNRGDYPSEIQNIDYPDRMRAAYPIHPELFDRLYSDWGTVQKFQRTRGVLRFMAAVIRELWARGDRNLLILPGTIPFDEPDIYTDLFRHLEERGWPNILETDVDGENAKAYHLDREVTHLGKLSAARRVSRTVFLPSPATYRGGQKGLEKKHILLGCVQPGEPSSTFGDALRRLTETSSYLYNDRSRYWYSLNPSAARIAQEIAAGIDGPHADQAIRDWIKDNAGSDRRDFKRIHPCPPGPADVSDELTTGLVILGPEAAHVKGADSPGKKLAKRILDERGNSSRTYRNTLLFLVPDQGSLESLREAARMHEAWQDVMKKKEALNLDRLQIDQATDQEKRSKETLAARMFETYRWLLAPRQPKPAKGETPPGVEWDELGIRGGDDFVRRVAEKITGEVFFTTLLGHALRHTIDGPPTLWRGDQADSVPLDQLVEDFARYLYLPRLASPDVLVRGIVGCAVLPDNTGSVAIADGRDQTGRFLNLRVREHHGIALKQGILVVHPEAADKQKHAEGAKAPTTTPDPAPAPGQPWFGKPGDSKPAAAPAEARRFYLNTHLDSLTPTDTMRKIQDNVLKHLVGAGGKPRVTVSIDVDLPKVPDEALVRTVKENCRVLKVDEADFTQS